ALKKQPAVYTRQQPHCTWGEITFTGSISAIDRCELYELCKMAVMQKIAGVVFLMFYFSFSFRAQIREMSRDERILTPSVFPQGNPVGYPIIELGSGQVLDFHFDEAGNDRE